MAISASPVLPPLFVVLPQRVLSMPRRPSPLLAPYREAGWQPSVSVGVIHFILVGMIPFRLVLSQRPTPSQRKKTDLILRSRFHPLAALLAILALTFLAGCGPNYKVPDKPAQAILEAESKLKVAEEAEKSRSAQKDALWQEAAGFYGAVAQKFPTQPEGMQAAIKSADLTSVQLKNDYGAWTALRQLGRQTINSTLPEKELVLAKEKELAQKMDKENSENIFYKIMDGLVRLCGGNPEVSPTIAIFVISIVVAVIMWPLQKKQYASFKDMAKYQPEIKKIQEKYKEEPMLMNQKLQEFNKQHGINPMQGCLMVIPQTVIFILMIQLIQRYQFHFFEAHFLWINPQVGKLSLTWPQPLTGAIAHHLGELDIPLLLLYAVAQWLQTKLLPPPSDPTQAEVQKAMTTFMPVIYFMFMLQNQVPSAFVLYYFVSTLFGMLRQWLMNRIHKDDPTGPTVLAAASTSGDNGGGLIANEKLISPKNRKKK